MQRCIVSDYAWAGLRWAKGSEIIVSDEWKICLCLSHDLQSTEKGDSSQFILSGVCQVSTRSTSTQSNYRKKKQLNQIIVINTLCSVETLKKGPFMRVQNEILVNLAQFLLETKLPKSSAWGLFKCQRLMGEWISDANSRMLITFATITFPFQHPLFQIDSLICQQNLIKC